MTNLVLSLNRSFFDGMRALDAEWRGDAGSVQGFDTYGLFEGMYHVLAWFLNCSVSANVTGIVVCEYLLGFCSYRSVVADDYDACSGDWRSGTHTWWDELHPSEQTGRNLAAEMHKKIEGKSTY